MSNISAGIAQIAGGILGGGAIVAMINGWTQRRKVEADAESVTIDTANKLMTMMRQDIAELRARVARQDAAVAAYGRRVDYLTGLLLRSGVQVEDWSAPS